MEDGEESARGTVHGKEIEDVLEGDNWREPYERFSVFSQYASIFHLEDIEEGSDIRYRLTVSLNNETNELFALSITVYAGDTVIESTNVDLYE